MIRIEDDFEDVLGKAIAGLDLSLETLAKQSGVDIAQIEALLDGKPNDAALRAIAPALELSGECLIAMARKEWQPSVQLPEWVAHFNTPYPIPGYEEMTVNSYLFWSGEEAVTVDTGAHAGLLIDTVRERGLELNSLMITHTHRDHVVALAEIREAFPEITVYCPAGEPLPDAVCLNEGSVLACGTLQIEVRETSGHAPGGVSYIVTGSGEPVAFVGDSIFCLSIGKAPNAYAQALGNNRSKLLSLPASTILCPGHGPVTTVGGEAERNPFFAE